MKLRKPPAARQAPAKIATGVTGFDELSYGGLRRNRTTLLMGGPGAGKTVFALQTLVRAARERNEPGIFVAFEETARQLVADAVSFDWGLAALVKTKIFVFEARLSPDIVHAGEFDLRGMLAMLAAKKKEMGASWIVFDGLDVLLTLLHDPIAEMREVYRIRDWLADNGLNAIVTAKLDGAKLEAGPYDFMQFMLDCVVRLSRRLEDGVSLHRLQITKYRGSDFVAGEHPVSFGPSGMEVGAPEPPEIKHIASNERLSAGFERFDRMLGGGLFRGSSMLITGVPGTSKTTLAGKFAEAACLRGERTLFVSFDEGAGPIVRNLASVGIDFKPHLKSGVLRMYSGRTESIGAEDHLVKLKALLREHRPRCMVVDPLSALAKSGRLGTARAVANRLIYMVKDRGITVVVTAISEGDDPQTEATELQISTVADTWVHLSYIVRSGERNRALTIIKSRGTWHSNQVRELILSKAGPMLADVYTAGGEVLMGTLRWEKEEQDKIRTTERHAEFDEKRGALEVAEADTHARVTALQLNLQRQRIELARYSKSNDARITSSSEREQELGRIRSADPERRALPPRNGRKAPNGSHKGKTTAARSTK
jgi:circadian clock protein KaiC